MEQPNYSTAAQAKNGQEYANSSPSLTRLLFDLLGLLHVPKMLGIASTLRAKSGSLLVL
jgi:hypothetical protein